MSSCVSGSGYALSSRKIAGNAHSEQKFPIKCNIRQFCWSLWILLRIWIWGNYANLTLVYTGLQNLKKYWRSPPGGTTGYIIAGCARKSNPPGGAGSHTGRSAPLIGGGGGGHAMEPKIVFIFTCSRFECFLVYSHAYLHKAHLHVTLHASLRVIITESEL